KNLNNSQKQAVNEINNSTSYKIIGPPGTGKTSTIVEIISQLLKRRKKILVCGPSNISIDNIIEKFESSIFYSKTPTKFYRRGSSFKGLKAYNLEKIVDEITKFVEKEDTDKNFKRTLKKIKDKYKNEIQLETDLVFATVFSSRKELNHFDWVIVDEACQSSAVECFLALTHGQNIILVGDPNQLCHEFRSLYELLDMKTYLLDVQYRMCERLIGFSNETFYNNKIKSFIK
ncbi:DNA polymerase alpha-associated DNA helicase A, partial [Nosema granulosis]